MTTARLSYRLGGTDSADVLVVGAGLAGLNTATLLARQGHDVLLVERRTSLAGAIRTTGIFVRKTLDDFPLPPDCLGPPIRRVVLYPPPDLRRPVSLTSPRDEYRVGDMAPLYEATAATAVDAGVRIALGTRYAGRQGNTFHLAGRDGPTAVRARFIVGADGARSRVARDLALDRNHLNKPGLVVLDITAADEATATEAATSLGGIWLSSGPSAPWRTPGRPGVTVRACADLRRTPLTAGGLDPTSG